MRTVQKFLSMLALALALVLPAAGQADPKASPRYEALPRLKTLSSMFQDPRLVTTSGKEFELIEFRAAEAAKPTHRFLVQGGLHGNEVAASEFVLWLARRYARGESILNRLPRADVAIDFVPYANPDGSEEKSRYNAKGVNLNRNFGVLWGVTRENPGETSFSEPETRAIRRLFKARKYTAAVDVHGYINWVVSPSAPADVVAQGGKPTARQKQAYGKWIESLQREMPLLPGYQLKNGARLGDGGAFEDWAFWSEGTLAYCLELQSLQRFQPNYRADFADLTKRGTEVDLFKRYEMFVYRMFQAAIEIKNTDGLRDSLAAE